MTANVIYTRTDNKPDFITNTDVPFSQFLPDVTGLSNGAFVVAYVNELFTNAGNYSLDFYGADLQSTRREAAGAQVPEGAPSLTQLTNGNVLVVWDDHAGDAVNGAAGLRGHLYSQAGVPIGGVLTLAGTNDFHFADPQVAALAGGGFVMSYTYAGSGQSGAGSVGSIAYARYDAAGALLNSPAVDSGQDKESAVAALADGGFVVSYEHSGSSTGKDIHAAIYNADGSPRIADVSVDAGSSDQTQSRVVGLPSGNFAAVYTDGSWNNENGSSGITLRIFSPTGADLTPNSFVHVNVPSNVNEADPDITVLANGFIVVTWTHPTSTFDIYGRVFDQNGNPVTVSGSQGEYAIASKSVDESSSAISHITGGRFVTSWSDQDGSDGGIHSTVSTIFRSILGDGLNDTFVGDQIEDRFAGFGGNDTFVYKPGGFTDLWTDFSAGPGAGDRIGLTAFINIHNLAGVLAHASAGASTVLDFGHGDSLTLTNVARTALSADDFIFNPFRDYNGDGFGDILFRNNSTGDTGYTDVHNGGFHSLGGSSTAYGIVGAGDYNGDGFSDLLFRNNSSGDTGYTDVHNGGFHSLGGSPAAYSVVASGDYNDDGFSDLLFRDSSTGDTGYTDVHNGGFHSLGGSPVAYSIVGSGDYNGDNFSDLLFRNNSTGDTGYTDVHNGGFHSLGGSPVNYSIVGSGDYNGDGFSDLLFRDNSTGDAGYTDIHNGGFHSLGGSPLAYSVVGSADYNGDGFSDILFRNNATGDTGYTDIHNGGFHSLGGSPADYLVAA